MCKKPLKFNDFHQITYKPQDLVVQEEEAPVKFDHERHSTNAIYSDISSGLLKEIKNIDLNGSFGTKIDTLARHVLWLREHDPGAKSIIFSQYKNFLAVLQRAFQRFGIVNSSVDAPSGIENFKRDPAVRITRNLPSFHFISVTDRPFRSNASCSMARHNHQD